MNSKGYHFEANRTKTTWIVLLFGFLIIFVSVVIPIILLPEINLRSISSLGIPILFGLFFTFVLASSVIKVLVEYTIDDYGIRIRKPFSKPRIIKWNQIKAISYLDENETSLILDSVIRDQFEIREGQDIAGYIRLLRTKSPLYKYFTMINEARVITSGETGHLYSLKLKKTEGMVCMELNDGSKYYLTPNLPLEFSEKCIEFMNK